MSEISLYSGLYETIRRWADLIDDAILSLKTGKSEAGQGSYNALYRIFSTLGDKENSAADFSDRRVASIIEAKLGKKTDWQALANTLNDPSSRKTALPTLEAIAQFLAEKHAETVAKMRWGHP